jgi:entericidin B
MHQPKLRSVIVPIFALLALGAVAACETVAGAGKDVSSAGDAVTGAAQETKAEIAK